MGSRGGLLSDIFTTRTGQLLIDIKINRIYSFVEVVEDGTSGERFARTSGRRATFLKYSRVE